MRALFAIGSSAVGSSIFFSLGVVADRALGATPLVFTAVAFFFLLTLMTYAEVGALHPERGGASSFARHAFDELWSFVAGWAILLDYLIVIAIAAFSVSHYLAAFWGGAGRAGFELLIAGAAIAAMAYVNIRGIRADRISTLLRVGLVNLAGVVIVMVVGLALLYEPGRIVDSIDFGRTPTLRELVFGAVLATLAFTGIEAASGLAGEIVVGRRALRRGVFASGLLVFGLFIGMATVALSAAPVQGGQTALGGPWVEAPVLGVVSAFEPPALRDGFRYGVGALAAVVLVVAVAGNMLGLSRVAYSLATNRQIPAPLGRLHPRYSTPHVAIGLAAALAFGLAATSSIDFLAGLFAFGSMLTVTIAHASVIVLRYREPGRRPAYAIPLSVRVGGGSLPLPAVLGLFLSAAAWVSVLLLHEGARVVGLAWMGIGLLLYVLYRRREGLSLTQRETVTVQTLQGDPPDVEYGSILVPVFGRPLDDDIVGTAGRLASEDVDPSEGGAVIEALYVIEVPMSLPLEARMPEERVVEARAALARAKEVGEEYEGVEVATALVRARSAGARIVEEARRRGVEAIVLAAEEPTRVRGGALLGGRGGPRDKFLGEIERYVLEKAPCRVVLTAPALSDNDAPEPPPAP